MENTNPNGSESLDVNQAASAFEGMMGDSEEADNSQTEGQPEDNKRLMKLSILRRNPRNSPSRDIKSKHLVRKSK